MAGLLSRIKLRIKRAVLSMICVYAKYEYNWSYTVGPGETKDAAHGPVRRNRVHSRRYSVNGKQVSSKEYEATLQKRYLWRTSDAWSDSGGIVQGYGPEEEYAGGEQAKHRLYFPLPSFLQS